MKIVYHAYNVQRKYATLCNYVLIDKLKLQHTLIETLFSKEMSFWWVFKYIANITWNFFNTNNHVKCIRLSVEDNICEADGKFCFEGISETSHSTKRCNDLKLLKEWV